jgi:AraC family ethanolamine operon transcriptional activator
MQSTTSTSAQQHNLEFVHFDPSAMAGVVQGGRLEHTQVEKGGFRGHMAHSSSEQLRVDWGRYTLAVHARGNLCADRLSLGLMVGGNGTWRVLGAQACDGDMIVLPEGGEIAITLPTQPEWLMMQVSRARLEMLGIDLRGLLSTSGWHIAVHQGTMEQTVREVAGVLIPSADAAIHGSPTCDAAVLAQAHEQLFAGMVSAWVATAAASGDRREVLSSSERWRVVRRAEDYLADHTDCTVRMDELCSAACTSLSRLDRSFREVLGVSPRRFLMLRRMAAVRGELLAGRPGTTVTDTAMRWGFFHLGRFAEEYGALFSELPSQTLRAASASRRL